MAIEGLGHDYLGCASFVLSPLACIQCCRLWSQPLSRLKPDLFITVFDILRTFDSNCVPLELFLIAFGSCIVHGFQQNNEDEERHPCVSLRSTFASRAQFTRLRCKRTTPTVIPSSPMRDLSGPDADQSLDRVLVIL